MTRPRVTIACWRRPPVVIGLLVFVGVIPSSAAAFPVAPATIWTVAGSDKPAGLSGDGAAATDAQLNAPSGLAVDAAGDVLVADTGNNRVRRVSPSGTITTVAGTSTGFSGDGGPATAAQLDRPRAVAVDAAGGILIADTANNRVRRVDVNGTITTIAGTGIAGFAGDNGPAIAAQLNAPSGLAVDAAGNVMIADTGNGRVRRVSPSGTITTVAGTSTGFSGDGGPATAAELNRPGAVAVDAAGGILIADTANNRVRRVDVNGTITTIAGTGIAGIAGDNGPAIAAQLSLPTDIAVDTAGDIFIADSGNNRVRVLNPSRVIATAAGSGIVGGPLGDGGAATTAGLASPTGAAVDAGGNILIADSGDNRIRWVAGPQPGPDGPPGPGGATGPPGPTGGEGAPAKLEVVAYQTRVTARNVAIRYLLSAAATITLRITGSTVAAPRVATIAGKAGRNVATWNRKFGRARAGAGSYTITLLAAVNGQTATTKVTVRLGRVRRPSHRRT